MRKVEEFAPCTIVVENRPTEGTYYLGWWDSEAKRTSARELEGSSLAEVRPEALDLASGMISAGDVGGQ